MLHAAKLTRGPLPRRNDGFTLIELLVAMVITLIMMGAVASIFGLLGNSVGASRSLIETNDRLRGAANRLQLDLQGVTATMLPPLRPEEDKGYFEAMEGPFSDSLTENTMGISPVVDLNLVGNANFSRLGDTDDILMFTTHSNGEPFVGKVPDISSGSFNTNNPQYLVRESQTAEVVWLLRKTPGSTAPNITYTLYRQVLLVRPGDDLSGFSGIDRQYIEISLRKEGTDYKGNTLGDLTKRENRFGHNGAGFPFPTYYLDAPLNMQGFQPGTPRYGEDVMLTNVIAFDVRAFDPDAQAATPPAPNNNNLLFPGDPGYFAPGNTFISPPVGAFVDLGYNVNFDFSNLTYGGNRNGSISSWFSGLPEQKSGLVATYTGGSFYPLTYDTYSLHYENDRIDQFGDSKIDQGFDGLDNDTSGPGAGVVDDIGERETLPPYSKPLRGIQVTIRVYEPDSRQVREVTIVQNFVPE